MNLHDIGFIGVPASLPLPPVGTHLQLSRRTTLVAPPHVSFRILTPDRTFGAPDEVCVDGPPPPGG